MNLTSLWYDYKHLLIFLKEIVLEFIVFPESIYPNPKSTLNKTPFLSPRSAPSITFFAIFYIFFLVLRGKSWFKEVEKSKMKESMNINYDLQYNSSN